MEKLERSREIEICNLGARSRAKSCGSREHAVSHWDVMHSIQCWNQYVYACYLHIAFSQMISFAESATVSFSALRGCTQIFKIIAIGVQGSCPGWLFLQSFVPELHQTQLTVSGIGLEFFSSIESCFSGALHLQSTVELLLQYPSQGIVKPVPL